MKIHVVDGTFELFRAHYSPRPGRTAPDGKDVKATVGLVGEMLNLLADPDEAPTHLAIAFDNPIRSFRNELFPAYKSDEGVPPELRSQFDLVEEAVRALGLAVWSMDRFEADDALGAAAARYADRCEQVRILSPDKDLAQAVREEKVVLVDRIRRRVSGEAEVLARFGVPPSAIPDRLALTGDSADGIPGLPGFGEKTATALLQAFGRIEAIPTDAATWPRTIRGADRLAAVLAERREDALLYRTLATLALDAPIPDDPEAIRVGALGGPAFAAVCERLGSKTLAERAALHRAGRGASD